MTVLETRYLGRAKNVVLRFLEDRLIVPKIYLDADWSGERVDVLAIDRDGGGDVSAVLLASVDLSENVFGGEYLSQVLAPLLNRLYSVPAQYKYLAAVSVGANAQLPLAGFPHQLNDRSFSADGIGRVGFLEVQGGEDGVSNVKVLCKPERFRAKIAKLADEYVQKHEADWEIRA